MWHRSAEFFAFATMPNALFAFADVPRELSEEKFADFLVLNHAVHETTIYRNVFRIPPAHVMQVKADGSARQRRYWSPAEIMPIKLASNQAYAEGLRACLDVAVRRQMRSAYPVGCLLSGGLELVGGGDPRCPCARREEPAAFRLHRGAAAGASDGPISNGHYADETPYVDAIARADGNIDVNYVRSNECIDLAELERFFIALQGPVRNPSLRLDVGDSAACARERAAGAARRLSGELTISWDGSSQAVDHLTRGPLLTAYRQWLLLYRLTSYSRWTALRKLFVEPLMVKSLGKYAARRRHAGGMAAWQEHAAIRPDFAAAMGVDIRAWQAGHDFLSHAPGRTAQDA